jgi:hypothetical protein
MDRDRKSDGGNRAAEFGTRAGGDLFIVDNSDEEWKGIRYLREWAQISTAFDIATGFFEIGSLLALDGEWQKLEKIRILMGAETTKRTARPCLTRSEPRPPSNWTRASRRRRSGTTF